MVKNVKPENETNLTRHLKRLEKFNKVERAESRLESIKKAQRTEIIRDHPFASAEEIEIILARRLSVGAKPTSAEVRKKPPFKPAVGPDRLFRLKKRR